MAVDAGGRQGSEDVLAEVVRSWAAREFPGDDGVASAAEAAARAAFADGMSVTEACRRARSLASSWAHHPAHWRGWRDAREAAEAVGARRPLTLAS